MHVLCIEERKSCRADNANGNRGFAQVSARNVVLCAAKGALHDLSYDGVQLITHLMEAEYHLDDIISKLTSRPAAIVLDLGLGADSGFTLLRKCHAEPKLQRVPILVWTKRTYDLSKTFSEYLGAQDFL
jgi:DNA-binding response OmpR family regulator